MSRIGIGSVAIALGSVLSAILLAQIGYGTVSGQLDTIIVLNTLFMIPFLAMLIGGGYWLERETHPLFSQRRIGYWLGGGGLLVGIMFLGIAATTLDVAMDQIGAVIWGTAAGSGTGLLVGMFEARAITSARRAERARTRNQEIARQNDRLESFASIVSHDLRNPLSVATGRLELAMDDGSNEHLETVDNALQRVDSILSDTLFLARQGRVITETESRALTDLARDAWGNVDTGSAERRMEGSFELECDPERLGQVFENLFRNAIEHGSGDVTIWVGPLDSGGFYVEDDGTGIPEATRESIFEPGETAKPSGTGFGLAIVRSIVTAHDWHIHVVDGRKAGARFEIAFESPRETETRIPV